MKTSKVLYSALTAAIALAAIAPASQAQFGGGQRGQNNAAQNNNRNGGGGNGGVLELPKGVNRVISIDAQNVLLAETESEDGEKNYSIIAPRHIYSGGLARLFGGDVIPTEQFVSPAFNNNGGGFGNGGGGFQPGGNGFNGGGFNGPRFGTPDFQNNNEGGFQNVNPDGYDPNGGFNNGAYPQTQGGYDPQAGFPINGGYFNGQGRIAPNLNRRAPLTVRTGNRLLNGVIGLLDRPVPQVSIEGGGQTSSNQNTQAY